MQSKPRKHTIVCDWREEEEEKTYTKLINIYKYMGQCERSAAAMTIDILIKVHSFSSFLFPLLKQPPHCVHVMSNSWTDASVYVVYNCF